MAYHLIYFYMRFTYVYFVLFVLFVLYLFSHSNYFTFTGDFVYVGCLCVVLFYTGDQRLYLR